jgi:hypothetical protein
LATIDRRGRILLALGALFALVVNGPRTAPIELTLLGLEWLLLAVSVAVSGRAASVAFATAAVAAASGWAIHPSVWLLGLAMLGIAWIVRGSRNLEAPFAQRIEAIAIAVAVLAPGALSAVILAVGGAGASVMRKELLEVLPKYGLGRAALAASALAV